MEEEKTKPAKRRRRVAPGGMENRPSVSVWVFEKQTVSHLGCKRFMWRRRGHTVKGIKGSWAGEAWDLRSDLTPGKGESQEEPPPLSCRLDRVPANPAERSRGALWDRQGQIPGLLLHRFSCPTLAEPSVSSLSPSPFEWQGVHEETCVSSHPPHRVKRLAPEQERCLCKHGKEVRGVEWGGKIASVNENNYMKKSNSVGEMGYLINGAGINIWKIKVPSNYSTDKNSVWTHQRHNCDS